MVDLSMCCWGVVVICTLPFALAAIIYAMDRITFIIVAFLKVVSNVVTAIFGKRGKRR